MRKCSAPPLWFFELKFTLKYQASDVMCPMSVPCDVSEAQEDQSETSQQAPGSDEEKAREKQVLTSVTASKVSVGPWQHAGQFPSVTVDLQLQT